MQAKPRSHKGAVTSHFYYPLLRKWDSSRVAEWCGTSADVIERHYAGSIAHIQVPHFDLTGKPLVPEEVEEAIAESPTSRDRPPAQGTDEIENDKAEN